MSQSGLHSETPMAAPLALGEPMIEPYPPLVVVYLEEKV